MAADKSTREHFEQMRKMKPDEISRHMVENGKPTTGALAEALWHLLSGFRSPFHADVASSIYDAAGYVPFKGYPLHLK